MSTNLNAIIIISTAKQRGPRSRAGRRQRRLRPRPTSKTLPKIFAAKAALWETEQKLLNTVLKFILCASTFTYLL